MRFCSCTQALPGPGPARASPSSNSALVVPARSLASASARHTLCVLRDGQPRSQPRSGEALVRHLIGFAALPRGCEKPITRPVLRGRPGKPRLFSSSSTAPAARCGRPTIA
mmetsp:Transcript_34562/g.111014  ORF Transcript_34562/g.111014 Transcript_34562/m.111014 type:complete len:111 (-) Transcript_34562:860-1192(-)